MAVGVAPPRSLLPERADGNGMVAAEPSRSRGLEAVMVSRLRAAGEAGRPKAGMAFRELGRLGLRSRAPPMGAGGGSEAVVSAECTDAASVSEPPNACGRAGLAKRRLASSLTGPELVLASEDLRMPRVLANGEDGTESAEGVGSDPGERGGVS
jgi:hypothetical protein